jgi:hypothetical protein
MLSNISKLLKIYNSVCIVYYFGYNSQNVDPDIIVGITTHCGLKGQGIESGGCEIFRTISDRPESSPNLQKNGYKELSPGGLTSETRH